MVFVNNATAGVNSVLRSLTFRSGDEILVTTHGYNACNNVARFVAQQNGAALVVAEIPSPLDSPQQVIDAVLAQVTSRTGLPFSIISAVRRRWSSPSRRLLRSSMSGGLELDRRRRRAGHGAAGPRPDGGHLLHGQLPQMALRAHRGPAFSMSAATARTPSCRR